MGITRGVNDDDSLIKFTLSFVRIEMCDALILGMEKFKFIE